MGVATSTQESKTRFSESSSAIGKWASQYTMSKDKSNDFMLSIISSASAGSLARFISHPMDTVKSRLQAGNSLFRGTFDAFAKTYRSEGIRGLYRGFGVATFGGVPGVCVYLTSYDSCKNYLSHNKYFSNSSFSVYFLSGMFAEIMCSAFFVPVDVIKERLQVQIGSSTNSNKSQYDYQGSWDGIKKVIKNEGPLSLYRGFGATILAYAPFSALYFLIYEELKKFGDSTVTFSQSLIYSATAGAIASYTTNPLDLVKLRLQVQRASNGNVNNTGSHYKGFFDGLYTVYRVEGVSGMFRGATARVLFHAPNTAITMALYEFCKNYWTILLK